jgi:hypothetical protein
MTKPRKPSRKTLAARIQSYGTNVARDPDDQDLYRQWSKDVDTFHMGEEAAGWLRDFRKKVGPLINRLGDLYEKSRDGGGLPTRAEYVSILRGMANTGFEAAARLAYEKQLAATATAVTKSQGKAAERRRQIVETFRAMTGGTKTARVRRTADELEVSASAVWDALRDAD